MDLTWYGYDYQNPAVHVLNQSFNIYYYLSYVNIYFQGFCESKLFTFVQ